MMNFIHYLVNNNTHPYGLIHPSEIEEENYRSFGAFYIMSRDDVVLEKEYVFHAILGDEIIVTNAIQTVNSKNVYQIEVKEVGNFIFYAESIRQAPYVGSNNYLNESHAIKRFRCRRQDELEKACSDHDFYFVGASKMINDNFN